jgi:integrase/recombinase XerD
MLTRRLSTSLDRPGAGRDVGALDSALGGVLSDHSRRAYAGDFRDLARWLHPEVEQPSITPEDLVSLTVDDLTAYRDELRRGERKLSTATINRRLAAIRKLLQAAVDRKLRPDNPAKAVKGFKTSSRETPGMTEDEARHLLAQPDRETLLGLRDYALLQVMIRLGLRREEVFRLRTTSFAKQRGRRVLHVEGKGDKQRMVVVPGDVYDHVAAWRAALGTTMEEDAPLFVELKAQGRAAAKIYVAPQPDVSLSVNGLWKIVTRHAAAAGLQGITPHSMRATCITIALAHDAPLQKVQYMAGHSDPRTTERYDRNRQAIDNPATDYIPVL